MNKSSILRILIDLIKSDSVIETNEIKAFNKMVNKYKIYEDDRRDVVNITLADAIKDLQESEIGDEFIKDIEKITVVDGFCVKREALLLIALHYCLLKPTIFRSEVISINVSNISISEGQVLYVESVDGKRSVKMDIDTNFHTLNADFKLAGLNFFYIPEIAKHYRQSNPETFKQICSFLAPNFSTLEIENMYSYITSVTTKKFCNEQLCGKLGMSSLYNTSAAFLVHIGSSFVNHKLYNNFLKVDFDNEIGYSDQLLEFLKQYTKYLSYDVVVIPKVDETQGHFLYSGFYKYLFDLYLRKDKKKSPICIDLIHREIFFPGIGKDFKLNVGRLGKVIYAMILLEMENGAVDFTTPNKKNHERIIKKFTFLYNEFGGDIEQLPKITEKNNLKPILTKIKKFFVANESILADCAGYMMKKQKENPYLLRIIFDGEISVSEAGAKEVPLRESNLIKRYRQI